MSPKTLGRRAYDLYTKIPGKHRDRVDNVIRSGARATKGLRQALTDKEARKKKGRALIDKIAKRIPI